MEKERQPGTLSVDRAAEVLGISRAAVYRAAGRGEIPSIRIGGRILVLRSGLERLLSNGDGNVPEAADGG